MPELPTVPRLALICVLAVVGFVVGPFVDVWQELRRREREAERAAENCAECHRAGVCCRWHWIERTE